MTKTSTPKSNPTKPADMSGIKKQQRLATNREAAKASRLRKKLQLEQLETNVLQLTQQNKDLLEENRLLRQKLNNYINLDQYRALLAQQAQEAQQQQAQQRLHRLQAAASVASKATPAQLQYTTYIPR
mmetsp:Transcript_3219/g.5054  ORF Transcript_3219/g.5054 Transcript_3219/m.5054 type:complete len:128 (+) Transcript_3219:62-445(+)|eukprot:CAMPEP_0196803318 /NCGR_PEP_ID=MMETSP1362-20130617/2666_1 /TAXON_ID=163516 /ORGANISM="Leptocylindrus danicus, Strain CCMP1856" /LENGTH=127 /DNA_ID=CAMNT_0042174795 /DNA_START=48 /DNA_END=431 /DNA_ORIENTATION=-